MNENTSIETVPTTNLKMQVKPTKEPDYAAFAKKVIGDNPPMMNHDTLMELRYLIFS